MPYIEASNSNDVRNDTLMHNNHQATSTQKKQHSAPGNLTKETGKTKIEYIKKNKPQKRRYSDNNKDEEAEK